MLGSRLACDSWRLAATKSEFEIPKTALPKLELPLTRFWGLKTLRYHVFPFRIWLRRCSTETRPGCDPT
jgi:hypothetical protein